MSVIYATRDMIQKEFGAADASAMEKAERLLTAETETYDMYLRGICFGYKLYEGDDEADSCWGFLGWFDDMKEDVRECLPDECASLIDQLESVNVSEEACLLARSAYVQQ